MAPENLPPPPSKLEGAALFLDFDGTLVDIADEPGGITVPAGLLPLLRQLSQSLYGRLAIISGRSIDDLDRHLDCSGTAIGGSHGLELRFADGGQVPLAVPEGLSEAASLARQFAQTRPGLLVEKKPASIAVHYRKAPDQSERVKTFMAAVAARTGLTVQPGKMCVEVRATGADKGDAMRAFMAEAPFAGAMPIFVGDDLTDEHAFLAAGEMGGGGVLVGAARTTAAKWRLPNTGAVADWLRQCVMPE